MKKNNQVVESLINFLFVFDIQGVFNNQGPDDLNAQPT